MRILNEVKYAENMVSQGFIHKKYGYELRILSKYYFSQGFYGSTLTKKIKEFCHINIPDFNEVKYAEMIRKTCIYGENNELFVAKPVRITQIEIDRIKSLNDLKIEKVAFVFLVLANISKQKYTLYIRDKIKYKQKILKNKKKAIKLPKISLYYYVNENINNIFTLAKVYLKRKERDVIIRILNEKDLIETNSKCQCKIKFIYHNTKDTALIIDNFDDFVLEYEKLIGDNVGYCVTCGKPIRITSNKRKYCNKCFKDQRRIYKTEKQKEYRKNKRGHIENSPKPLV